MPSTSWLWLYFLASRCRSPKRRWKQAWLCSLRPWRSPLWTGPSQTYFSPSSWLLSLEKSTVWVINTSFCFQNASVSVYIFTSSDLVSSDWPPASCDDLSVTLQPVSRQGERRAVALSGSGDTLSFSFDNVLPGKYKGQDSTPVSPSHS